MTPHRPFLGIGLGLVVALVLAACGGDEPAASDDRATELETVMVPDVSGEVEVPVTDEGVWALDEYTGQMLLALGVTPIEVADMYRDPFSLAVLEDAGIEPVAADNLELVAGARPRLIVGTATPSSRDLRARYEEIAPVVLPDFSAPWEDQLAAIAAAVGRTAEADAITRRVDERLDRLASRVDGSEHDGAVVSMVSGCGDGTPCTYDASTIAGTTLDRLGFERPASQVDDDATDSGFAYISNELLGDQGGDIIVCLVGSVSGGESILDDPFLPTDGAITADVDFGAWYAMSPLNAWIVLHDLEAILFNEGTITIVEDVPDRWDELIGAG